MATFLDLTGKRFGRLTVIGLHTERNRWGKFRWVCKCDCGRTSYPITVSLTSGITKTCGNYCVNQWDTTRRRGRKTKHLDYSVWMNMKTRCYNKSAINYVNYGARGIKVCERWKNSFLNFILDMGERPSKDYSIERDDVNGNYTPENCYWLLRNLQALNTRRTIRFNMDGVEYKLPDILRETGITGGQFCDLYYRHNIPAIDIFRMAKAGFIEPAIYKKRKSKPRKRKRIAKQFNT